MAVAPPSLGQPTMATVPMAAPAPAAQSLPQQLANLAALKDSGVLTAEQFEQAKSKLLSGM